MLKVQGLAYVRDQQLIFGDLTFDLGPGESLQIKGPNGAGKTSLLRMVAGLCAPSRGLLYCTPSRLYVGHQMGLHPQLNPLENLSWLMCLQGHPVERPAIMQVLEGLGLGAQRHMPAKQLSKGQCQRVGLARLALEPAKLWILDEPCTGLDAQGIEVLQAAVASHCAQGGSIVWVSHQALLMASFSAQTQVIGLPPRGCSPLHA